MDREVDPFPRFAVLFQSRIHLLLDDLVAVVGNLEDFPPGIHEQVVRAPFPAGEVSLFGKGVEGFLCFINVLAVLGDVAGNIVVHESVVLWRRDKGKGSLVGSDVALPVLPLGRDISASGKSLFVDEERNARVRGAHFAEKLVGLPVRSLDAGDPF